MLWLVLSFFQQDCVIPLPRVVADTYPVVIVLAEMLGNPATEQTFLLLVVHIAIQTILRISGSRLYGTIPDNLPA